MQPPVTKLRLAAILSADVRGFSRLMEADEAGTHRRLVEARRVIDGAIEGHGGRVVGSAGDSVLAEFPSAVEATTAAVEAQEVLTQGNAGLTSERRLEFRIGINVGEVIVDGDDIFGDGVNTAARLQALADPGGVWISGRVFDEVGSKLPYRCRARGTRRVKNLARPLRVYSVEWRGDLPAAVDIRSSWWLLAATITVAGLVLGGLIVASDRLDLVLPSANPLHWFGETAPPLEKIAAKPKVAVLPFDDQSHDPGDAYFSVGVTEDIVAALSRFQSLAVFSASATSTFDEMAVAPTAIHQSLGARYLVRGSVRRAGEQVRVAAELTDAERNVVLWSEHFDGQGTDVFSLQEEIAQNIVATLMPRLYRAERERAFAKPTDNLEAYDLVLRGRELLKQRSVAAKLSARELFEKAIAKDPDFAMAFEELSATYLDIAVYGWTEFPTDALRKAEALARQAIALNPGSTKALRILAYIFIRRGQYDSAIEETKRAIALNPSDGEAYAARAEALAYAGEIDEAIEYYRTALKFVPEMRRGATTLLGICYLLKGRHDEAIRVLENLTSRDPGFAFGHVALAAAHAEAGHDEAAASEAATVLRLAPFFRVSQFGTVFQVSEHRDRLAESLRKAGLPE